MSSDALDTVGVIVANSPDFVGVAMDLLRQGRVVVPLRAQNDTQRIQIASPRELVEPKAGSGWFSGPPLDDRSERVAQLMFTSGTEGEPKCITLRHRTLFDVVERLNGVMHLDSTIREYVGVPVYYSFGFGRCRAIMSAGGRGYIPESGFNPSEIAALLERGEINAISAVPSLWRVLMSAGTVSPKLAAKVKWIEIGSQYMSREEKESLRALYSNAVIVQHYGLTEASRSTFLEIQRTSGEHLESVGRACGSVELKITESGRIAIRGPHVTDRVTSGGITSDPRDAEGWLETNDLGELRDGYLHYLGRADDVINCGGLKLPPEVLEAKVSQILGVSGAFAICRSVDRLRGDGILIAVTPEVQGSDSTLLEAVAGAAQDFGVNARGAIRIARVDELPRTTTGKVQRRTLSEQHGLAAEAPHEPVIGGESAVRRAFRSQLGARSLSGTESFVALGGDSLAFIQMSVALEAAIGYLPRGWEHAPIAELERLPVRRSGRSSVEAIVWMRALAIMAIVSNHVGLFGAYSAPGGAFLLFVLAGATFARFQLQRVVLEGTAGAVLNGLPKLLVPTLGLLLIQQLRHRHLEPAPLLLVSNFISPELGGYWFIEVWVQTYVVLFILLSFPPLAKFTRDRPLLAALTALAVGLVVRVTSPLLWDSDHLFNRLPQFTFWSFALGWVIALFGQTRPRLITALILVFAPTLSIGVGPKLWVTLGALGLLWLPPLRLHGAVSSVLAWVSAASLYIYIAQAFFFTFAERLTPMLFPFSGWVLAIVGGGLLRVAADYAWSFLRSQLGPIRALRTGPG
jgi:non-ribosomal peptide synthetase component E (peptide arylation enzyme)